MAIQEAKIIRETLELEGFELSGKWLGWCLRRQIDGFARRTA